MSSSLAVVGNHAPVVFDDFDDRRVELIRKQYANNAPQLEFELFLAVCRRTGLSPEARQIYFISRGGKWTIQTSIDGYRLIADRSKAYAGSDDPIFEESGQLTGPRGKVRPDKATVTVWKIVQGIRCPFTSSARWDEYVATDRDGKPTGQWLTMPYLMLGKCGESLALRKAFPAELSAVYTDAEMDQAGGDVIDASAVTVREAQASPVSNTSRSPVPDQPATPQQIKFVQGIARELGLNEDQLNDEAKRVGGSAISEIGRRGASALIEWLQARRGMADLSGPGPSEPESPPARTPSVSQSPSPRKAESAPTPSQSATEPPKPTTPMQRLHGAAKRRGLEHPDVHALALLWYDVESTTKLTAQQVAGFVAALEPDSDQSVSDEQLAADLFKAREAVRLNAPEPNSPADLAAIEQITSTPSTAPAPEAEHRQQIEGELDNWTAFWRYAREQGFKTKSAIEDYLGHSVNNMNAAQVRAELDSRQAAQK